MKEQIMKELFLVLIKTLNDNPNDTVKFLKLFKESKTFEVLDNRGCNNQKYLLIVDKIIELEKSISPQRLERLVIMKKENVIDNSMVIMIGIEKITLISILGKIIETYDYEPRLFMLI